MRLARSFAALAASSLALWPSAVEAQDELSATHEFVIPGTNTTCFVDIRAFVYEGGAAFSMLTRPDVAACEMQQGTIFGYALDAEGDEVSGRSGSFDGNRYLDLQLYQGVEIVRGVYEVWFAGCSRDCTQSYTLEPK